MKVRTRLTLWSAGIMFVSLLVMGGLSYHELVIDRRGEGRSGRDHGPSQP